MSNNAIRRIGINPTSINTPTGSLSLCAYYLPVLGGIYNLLAYGTSMVAAHGNFILWASAASAFEATYTVRRSSSSDKDLAMPYL